MDKNKETENKKKQEEMQKDASELFREAFYAKAEEIEDRAKATELEIDGARMEALYQRILKNMAETTGEPTEEPTEKPTGEPTEEPDKSGIPLEQAAEKQVEGKQIEEKEPAPKTSKKILPIWKRPLYHTGRWVAVLVLVCVGVVGVSIQSQAGKDGLWSSIQRLIGVESRWEQKNNDENRMYTDTDEWKAIAKIEEKLGIVMPEFYYWPKTIPFSEYIVDEVADAFTMVYQNDMSVVYFEGWKNVKDISELRSWENEGKTRYEEHGGVKYKIIENNNENTGNISYYIEWTVNDISFLLSGMSDMNEIEKILKNIKN